MFKHGTGTQTAPVVPLTEPVRLCNEPLVSDCRSPSTIERWLRSPHLRILQATRPAGGNQGAYVLTLEETSGPQKVVFRAKWRPTSASHWVNRARYELVAYATQQLFLAPEQYVVPPTSGHCFPLEPYRKFVDSTATADWPDRAECVHGYLTYWLSSEVELAVEAVGEDDFSPLDQPRLLSEERFRQDDVYARKLARLNTVAFVIDHGDAHKGQFLVGSDPFRVYSIDHTVALTSPQNPMVVFHEDWSTWLVPAVPAQLAERILSLEEKHVAGLSVLEVYEKVGGHLVPSGRPDVGGFLPPEQASNFGFRWHEGHLQVGTKATERALIWARIQKIQEMLRSGRISRLP